MLPRLIARRMRQWLLVIAHRAEVAHVKPSAARFAFSKMFGFGQRRPAGHLADDFPARDRRRHARNLGQAFLASPSTPWSFSRAFNCGSMLLMRCVQSTGVFLLDS